MRLSVGLRARCRGRINHFDFRQEAVTTTGNRFYETGAVRRVTKRLADFANRFIKPMVEIHEGVRRPKSFLEFLASYHVSGMLKQHRQDLQGLFLKANPQAVLAQFAGAKIQLENSKSQPRTGVKVFMHEGKPSESECTTQRS